MVVTGIEKTGKDFEEAWPNYKRTLQNWKDADIKNKALTLGMIASRFKHIIGAPD
jgi:hypothetical protein